MLTIIDKRNDCFVLSASRPAEAFSCYGRDTVLGFDRNVILQGQLGIK